MGFSRPQRPSAESVQKDNEQNYTVASRKVCWNVPCRNVLLCLAFVLSMI